MELSTAYPKKSLSEICKLFGITRQSVYQKNKRISSRAEWTYIILEKILKIRKDHPKMGGRKLYSLLKLDISKLEIKIGRDKFFEILSTNNLLIRKRRVRIRTTYSSRWFTKYKNKIKDKEVKRINEIWVSDITYLKIGETFVFITLILDLYSKKILGYNVSETLEAKGPLSCLEMALKYRGSDRRSLIHHSDRGIQYCSNIYTKLLIKSGIEISMTENGDPLENAVAERLNGIIKNEYLNERKILNIEEARKELSRAVFLYNNSRPHLSCDMHPSDSIYEGRNKPKVLWKNYYKNTNCILD